MACSEPIRIKAKQKERGVVRHDGYRMVPCGKCNGCRQRRINDWVLRLTEEDRHQNGGLFVTLTYAPEHVPMTENGFMTCSKRDVQLFMKRLRKNTGKKVKYYCAAEYGSKTQRPHYHLLMFGCNYDDLLVAWSKDNLPIGEVHVGQVSGASIAYSTKYISKEKQVPMHQRDDRVPEFSLSSTNLGKSYLTPQMVAYHKSKQASYFVKDGGYKAPLPRYYRDRIFTDAEKSQLNETTQERYHDIMNRQIEAAGGVLEYYRLRGDNARWERQILKLKHNNNHDKL